MSYKTYNNGMNIALILRLMSENQIYFIENYQKGVE